MRGPKPNKPYKGYPLFAHAGGVWAFKYKGKFYYFGPWSDPQGALKRFQEEMPYIYAGKTPPARIVDVATLLDRYLGGKNADWRAGEISESTYKEYMATTDVIAKHFGTDRQVETLTSDDFLALRQALARGTRKGVETLSLVTQKRRLTIARMVFAFANYEYDLKLKYKKPLEAPPKVQIRAAERERGVKLYEAKDIRKLVKRAEPEFKAMLLLGINCGFGPRDCATLPVSQVDLVKGWHTYWRPKTQVDRRCSLWPETVEAIKAVRGTELVFEGKEWNRWIISREFASLCEATKVKSEGFYSLRRTFETVAVMAPNVPQAIIDHIMGHSKHDMASIYRQKIYDSPLKLCSEFVRKWYLGTVSLK